jgi:hypothetical protein
MNATSLGVFLIPHPAKNRAKDNNFPALPQVIPTKDLRCFLPSNSYRKMPSKNELSLGRKELSELRYLISNQYGFEPQNWVMRLTKLTPTRRNWLRAILFESGCGEDFCSNGNMLNDWSAILHTVWHKLYPVY